MSKNELSREVLIMKRENCLENKHEQIVERELSGDLQREQNLEKTIWKDVLNRQI